ncbi:MAG TPA: hypothetical protein VJU18_00265 [Vicinamibacteria bacterium]|nr:hypothetical protein [Vicinamibacteria bacterium]
MKIQAGRMLAGGFLLFGLGSAAAHAGAIQGTITSAATTAPIESVSVNVYSATGQYVAGDATDALGAYSVSGLADGTYFARTNNALGYVDELYDNVACLGYCTVTNGTAIVVSGGATIVGIDFALNPGGRVSGTVTGTASAPLTNVRVEVLNSSGVTLASGYSDASGAYLTDAGLPTGSYLVRTRNNAGHVDELYDNVPCVGSCTLTGATPIAVTAGATTGAINFSLSAGGRVAGTVLDANTSAPLADITVSVVDAGGTTVTSGRTDAAGSYLTQAGLPGGTYFVRTNNSAGYVNELWNNVPCPGACPLTSATPVTIAAGTTVSGIDFDLTPGGRVSGTVTSSTTSSPLLNIWVQVVDARGGTVAAAMTDASGNYVTQEGLPTGSYFAHTSNSQGYVDQTYAGLVCAGSCPLTSATPISVTAGAVTPGITFALSPGGRVSGRVRDASTLLPLASIQVWIVSATGSFLTSGTTDGSGNYVTQAGLPAGSYYARTYRAAGYIDELHNNLPCVGTCNVTAGAGIVVSAGAITSGVDFDLQAGGRVSGTVTNAVSGTPLAGV